MTTGYVVAARPYYPEEDDRYIPGRIASLLVHGPRGSIIERKLLRSNIDAKSYSLNFDFADDGNVMLVEFQYDLVAVRGERAVDAARAAIDAISIADFTDDDLAEAKNCALSLLGVSVSGMSDYVDALCGFIAHSGRSDILDEYRHKISNVTRTEVATVLEELYQSADYIIEVSEEW